MKKTECVKVAVRCRPISSTEKMDNRQVIVKINQKRGEIVIDNPKNDGGEAQKTFTYDIVLPPEISQQEVYDLTALPIIEKVLEGYNGTIFAYGQTGTGKSHTMSGKMDPKELRGIIPRSFGHIFKVIEGTPKNQFLVRCSYIELYNEEVRDLLSKQYSSELKLREKPDSGVYIQDLSSFNVSSPVEMMKYLDDGHSNRHVGETKMNRESSRSHSIFMITIEMMEDGVDGKPHVRVGKLNLVDLAGSERQRKTQAQGERLKEAININQSLTTLGNVISALVDNKTQHVPYRDSKLTRLLQDSLGGNTKTVMIANIGPADYNFDETITTLRYANRAKNIKNKPKINEDPKDAQIRQYQEELNELKQMLANRLGGQIMPDGTVKKVKEVEKVVVVQDDAKMKEIQERIQREKQELHEDIEKDRKRIQEESHMAREQKQKLLKQLEEKEQAELNAQDEQEQLQQYIQKMEKKLCHGSELKAKQREIEKDLIQKKVQKEELEQQERRMAEELAKKEEQEYVIKDRYITMQDEIESKTKKLNQLIQKYKNAQQEKREIEEYRLREKDLLLEENRDITRELKLINLFIEHFVPLEEVQKLESRLEYSDEVDEWVLNENEEVKPSKPKSSLGFRYPMCEFSRMAITFGDANPRFRHDNILQLDLDLPERTTEDFDGMMSNKLQETINIALNEDLEEMGQLANEKMPNVYIENPELITKESVQNSQKQQKRLLSAKRPGSARGKQPSQRKY